MKGWTIVKTEPASSRGTYRFTQYGCILVISILAVLIGCAPKLLLKPGAQPEEIAVCLEYGGLVKDSIKSSIDSVTQKIIEDFNMQGHSFRLISCQNDNKRTLYLDVIRIQITDPGKQAAGVFVTTLGVITPFVMIAAGSPIYVTFAYLPRSYVSMNMKLSGDIAEKGTPKTRPVAAGSGKYFGSYETQKSLLLNGYYNRLQQEVARIANGSR